MTANKRKSSRKGSTASSDSSHDHGLNRLAPGHKKGSLLQQVREHKVSAAQRLKLSTEVRRKYLEELLQKVTDAIAHVDPGRGKNKLRQLERDILEDLYPRGSLGRALLECKPRKKLGRPVKDREGRDVEEQRKRGRTYGEIAKGDQRLADTLRKRFDRYTLRKGQKPN